MQKPDLEKFPWNPKWGIGNYLRFAPYIDPNEIHRIIEVGSRDAIDAILLGFLYECPVYAFECNPQGLELCYKNAEKYPYVKIVPLACWNETQAIQFFPIVPSGDGSLPNIGASSCFSVRPGSCESAYVQGDPITVQAVRLDEWMQENETEAIDLLCLDCQGATLKVLQGLGEKLRRVKYLITEAYLVPAWEGEALYPEIRDYLEEKGFSPVVVKQNFSPEEKPPPAPFCDILFINRSRTQ